MDRWILYVEDEPGLLRLAEAVFQKLGFPGRVEGAASLGEARAALARVRGGDEPPSLVVTDVGLPDGSGLELVREVKEDPLMRAVPVVVLSGSATPETVTEAYALGANAFFSKMPAGGDLLTTMESLVRCWLQHAELPRAGAGDRARWALARAVAYETRVAQIYLDLARALRDDPEACAFWLDLALAEGNHANLLRFFETLIAETDVARVVLDRVESQLAQVEACIAGVELDLAARPAPGRHRGLDLTLRIEECPSEELILTGLAVLLPRGPAAVAALAESLAEHTTRIVDGVKRLTQDGDLHRRAQALLARSEALRDRFGATPAPQH
ncbi:MAG: response regulator [Candidatus Dadabacteria bacterium]|nr:MAG: response regulator [Candidatus Dadabacteria bacterium]